MKIKIITMICASILLFSSCYLGQNVSASEINGRVEETIESTVEIGEADTGENATKQAVDNGENSGEKSSNKNVYWPDDISLYSGTAIMVEQNSGAVLYKKNANEKCYPASITKIMTAYLCIKYGNLDDIVTFSHDAVYKTEGSGIWRAEGEKLTLEQCLYALMLESANECAYAIAEHVGGTYDNFIKMMNDTAKELGCKHTHFANPNGLPDENHYTCAADMAKIACAAYDNETFRIVCGTKTYVIPKTNKNKYQLRMYNHHSMFCSNKTSAYLHDYCVGGKTGYTVAAGNTLVTYAKKDGMTLVTVVMKSGNPTHYLDTTKMIDYGFDHYKVINISEKECGEDASSKTPKYCEAGGYLELEKDAVVCVPKNVKFSQLQKTVDCTCENETKAGQYLYTYGNHDVGSANINVCGSED